MTVGVRDLKANLSRYLRRVQDGVTIEVTAHGRAIATIQPAGTPARDVAWAHAMVRDGLAKWSGGKPKGCNPPIKLRPGSKTASEIVIEDRG
jgi:prevent-host-death family protein